MSARQNIVVSTDGRRQRSERNRHQIVSAMFELVREGDFNPSAVKVAQKANVGLRTVFRHFDELDSLYKEMAEQLELHILPEIQKPLKAQDWRGQVKESITRRIKIFEEIMPIRTCASLHRFRSDFLMEGHKRSTDLEYERLKRVLPQELRDRESFVDALDVALCFETWRRLRQDRRLSRRKASAAVEAMVDALIASV